MLLPMLQLLAIALRLLRRFFLQLLVLVVRDETVLHVRFQVDVRHSLAGVLATLGITVCADSERGSVYRV